MSSCVASVLAELCRREPLGLGTGEDRSTTMRNSSSDQTWGMDTQSGASTAAFSSSSNARVIDWVWAEGHRYRRQLGADQPSDIRAPAS